MSSLHVINYSHFSGSDISSVFVFLSLRLKTRLEMHKALEQDSTVYDYDGVYDDIQKQRQESNKKVLGGADKRVTLFMHLSKLGLQSDVMIKETFLKEPLPASMHPTKISWSKMLLS